MGQIGAFRVAPQEGWQGNSMMVRDGEVQGDAPVHDLKFSFSPTNFSFSQFCVRLFSTDIISALPQLLGPGPKLLLRAFWGKKKLDQNERTKPILGGWGGVLSETDIITIIY